MPATDPEKLEPLRRRLRTTVGGGAVGSPGVLTVSCGRHPGSLHACMHREAPSFATFSAFGAAVRQHNAGGKEAPARPTTLRDEHGAFASLVELLESRPVVGVMGGYHPPAPVETYFELGAQLARDGFHVLTGGGGTMAGGPVTSLLAGFSSVGGRAGRAIGVVPMGATEGLNPFNDTLLFTNLPAGHAYPNSRNHLNVLLSDVIVALAGGPGTLHEIGLARLYGRALAADSYWRQMVEVPDEVSALPADASSFGFLAMPRFWEASGGAAAVTAAAAAGSGGGLRLTAEGRSMREGVAERVRGLEAQCYFSSLEALPYVASEAHRARGAERWDSIGT